MRHQKGEGEITRQGNLVARKRSLADWLAPLAGGACEGTEISSGMIGRAVKSIYKHILKIVNAYYIDKLAGIIS